MYSNGTDSDEEKWSHNFHYYGAGLTYNKDKLSVDVIYELLDHKGATDQEKTRLLNPGPLTTSEPSNCSVRMNLHSMQHCPELNLLKKRWQKPTTPEEPIITTHFLCLLQ